MKRVRFSPAGALTYFLNKEIINKMGTESSSESKLISKKDLMTIMNSMIRFEECAGCGQIYRLIFNGKLWLQPEHDCGV